MFKISAILRTNRATYLSNQYRADIDGLRSISIILVVLYHAFPGVLPGGYVGVDVFFVISGYLITGIIIRQKSQNKFSLVDFYKRRINRIFPPLLLVLIFVGVYSFFRLSLDNFITVSNHIVGAVTFTSNMVLWLESGYFDQAAEFKPLLHLWSLAVEEQFYLFWPLVLLALGISNNLSSKVRIWFLCILIVASLIGNIVLTSYDPVAAFYNPITRMWELGLGGLLAVFEIRGGISPKLGAFKKAASILSASCLTIIVLCAFTLDSYSIFPGWVVAMPTLAALGLIAVGKENPFNRYILSSKPFVFTGLLSYSIYLWHWPLITFLNIEGYGDNSYLIISAIIASVFLAILSLVFVENPVKKSKNTKLTIALVFSFLSIGIYGLITSYEAILPKRLVYSADLKSANTFNRDGIQEQHCNNIISEDSIAYPFCRLWGRDGDNPVIVLWGDSMSHAWQPPFVTLARERGWNLLKFSHAGCPPILEVSIGSDSYAKEWCDTSELQNEIFDAINRVQPREIFLIARWNLYYHGLYRNGEIQTPSTLNTSNSSRASVDPKLVMQNELPRTIRELSEISKLIVFKDTPVLKFPVDIALHHQHENFIPTLVQHEKFNHPINSIIENVVQNIPHTYSFDPSEKLCDEEKCSIYINNILAYSDDVHLTAAATMQFFNEINSMVEAE